MRGRESNDKPRGNIVHHGERDCVEPRRAVHFRAVSSAIGTHTAVLVLTRTTACLMSPPEYGKHPSRCSDVSALDV